MEEALADAAPPFPGICFKRIPDCPAMNKARYLSHHVGQRLTKMVDGHGEILEYGPSDMGNKERAQTVNIE